MCIRDRRIIRKCITPSKLHTCWQPTESIMTMLSWSSPHPISSSQLHVLPHFHLCPIDLVVFKGVYSFRMGYLILRGASRLDAFSVYPFRAWLPGYRLGSLTGADVYKRQASHRSSLTRHFVVGISRMEVIAHKRTSSNDRRSHRYDTYNSILYVINYYYPYGYLLC